MNGNRIAHCASGTDAKPREDQSPMEPSGIDLAVLIMFFCRPAQFAQVFEQVRLARPSRLYLHQDGARPGRPTDVIGIQRCREIAENVDWECEVHTLYQESNLGCGPAQYVAETWMFETEEMGIVLEDDTVPSQAFFLFCHELLGTFRHDQRIDRICGMNNTGISDHVEASYLFARKGSIWGWATWKRVLDTWDPDYSWLDDAQAVSELRNSFDSSFEYDHFLAKARRHRSVGVPFHESVGGAASLLQSRIMIVPKCNLVSCIGACEEASHCASETKRLPRRTRKLFDMATYDIDFPLSHPSYVIRDTEFERRMTVTRGQALLDKMESLFLTLRYGDFGPIVRRLRRWK